LKGGWLVSFKEREREGECTLQKSLGDYIFKELELVLQEQ
jgi:hypothetical protein